MKRAVVENRATPTNKSYKTLEHKFHPNLHLVFLLHLAWREGLKKQVEKFVGTGKRKSQSPRRSLNIEQGVSFIDSKCICLEYELVMLLFVLFLSFICKILTMATNRYAKSK